MADEKDEGYVREFLAVARGGLECGLLPGHGGRLVGLRVDGPDAEATGRFRGRRFRRRRRILPSQHPARLQAQLFVTALEERLLSLPLPPPEREGDIVDV